MYTERLLLFVAVERFRWLFLGKLCSARRLNAFQKSNSSIARLLTIAESPQTIYISKSILFEFQTTIRQRFVAIMPSRAHNVALYTRLRATDPKNKT